MSNKCWRQSDGAVMGDISEGSKDVEHGPMLFRAVATQDAESSAPLARSDLTTF